MAKALLVPPEAPIVYVVATVDGVGIVTLRPLKLPLVSAVIVPRTVVLVQVLVAQFHFTVTVSLAPKPVPEIVACDP